MAAYKTTAARLGGLCDEKIATEVSGATPCDAGLKIAWTGLSRPAGLRAPGSRGAAFPVLETELREAPDGDAILLIRPRELEPKLSLRDRRGGLSTGHEEAQRQVTLGAELVNIRLERAELFEGSARQNPNSL